MSVANLMFESKILNRIIYPMEIEIKENSNVGFEQAINVNIVNIIDNLNKVSCHVKIKYLKGSATYMQGNCSAEFIALPIDGYGWDDKTTTSKVVKVVFSNVVNRSISFSNKDCIAPTNDTFSKPIYIKSVSNNDLNLEIEKLSINLNNSKTFLLNYCQYHNVNISYINQSANIKNKTIKFLVTPNQGHEWKDSTIGSKIITVGLNNINIISEYDNKIINPLLTPSASIPVCDEWYEPIYIKKPDSLVLRREMMSYKVYFLNNIKKLKYFEKYKHVDISYLGQENYDNENNSTIKIKVIPKNGYCWEDNSCEAKIIDIYLKNLIVNNIEYKKDFDYHFKTHYVVKKPNMLTKFIDEIFKPNNLKEIYKEILKNNPYCKIDYWIHGTKKIISNSLVEIQIGISPIEGFAWIDKSIDTKKICVTLKNLYIPGWYPFMGYDA